MNDQAEGDEMGGTCSTNRGEKNEEIQNEREHCEDLDV
jgi:hypothetical protein